MTVEQYLQEFDDLLLAIDALNMKYPSCPISIMTPTGYHLKLKDKNKRPTNQIYLHTKKYTSKDLLLKYDYLLYFLFWSKSDYETVPIIVNNIIKSPFSSTNKSSFDVFRAKISIFLLKSLINTAESLINNFVVTPTEI